MPSDGQREAARMLRIAQRDLKAARSMLDADRFDETTWGFQIQQATEKALKAWIAVLGYEYPYTHDLGLLYRLIGDFGGDPSAFQLLQRFSPFGARLRYDDELESLNLDRATWNQRCSELLDHVSSLLP
jgi:HEPN domain-containing protein